MQPPGPKLHGTASSSAVSSSDPLRQKLASVPTLQSLEETVCKCLESLESGQSTGSGVEPAGGRRMVLAQVFAAPVSVNCLGVTASSLKAVTSLCQMRQLKPACARCQILSAQKKKKKETRKANVRRSWNGAHAKAL